MYTYVIMDHGMLTGYVRGTRDRAYNLFIKRILQTGGTIWTQDIHEALCWPNEEEARHAARLLMGFDYVNRNLAIVSFVAQPEKDISNG